MFQIWSIICAGFLLSGVDVINAQVPQVVESKCVNGEVNNGSCICEPEFTGIDCGVKISSPEELKLKESIYACFSEEILDKVTGSGSGSGSGAEPDEEPDTEQWTTDCENGYKRYYQGKCQFVNLFDGNIKIIRKEVPDLSNTSSTEYQETLKEVNCMLDETFSDLPFREVEITELKLDEAMIVVRYVIRTSRDVTSADLNQALSQAQTAVGDDLINDGALEDRNECERRELNDCNVLAKCDNTDGSYACTCPFNFTNSAPKGERPGSDCRHVCNDSNGGEYCLNEGECYITLSGDGVCSCPPNYAGGRCENEWHIFLNATIGLTAALGITLVIFVIVVLLLATRNRIKSSRSKSEFVELESNSANGEYIATSDDHEIKGISNPYISQEEGITVPTQAEDDGEALAIEDDKL